MPVIGQGDVPKDGQRISKAEAIEIQWKMVEDWKPRKDVFTLWYGPSLLAIVAGASGFILNKSYRNKLKLGSYGHASSYIPLVVMPAMLSAFFHRMFISSDIIIGQESCVVCTETKAVTLQTAMGVVYPLILAPSACYMLANRYNTVKMPDMIAVGRKKYWEFHMSTSKTIYKKVPYMILVQVVCASVVTYYDFKNFFHMNDKIIEIEKKMVENEKKFSF